MIESMLDRTHQSAPVDQEKYMSYALAAEESVDFPVQNEVLFDILGKSTKSGPLERAQTDELHSKLYTNTWKRDMFILEGTRLWYYSVVEEKHHFPSVKPEKDSQKSTKGENSAATTLSHFDLYRNSDHVAFMENNSSRCCVFIVLVENPQSFGEESMSGKDSPFHAGPLKIHLKAKNTKEANMWIGQINVNSDITVPNDVNDMMLQAEVMITQEQFGQSKDDVQSLAHLCTFEGMLANHFLRSKFMEYLERNLSPETLLFWERAEDYRRGCPTVASNQAFPFGGVEGALNPLQQRLWAKSIFDRFIAEDAPLQIADCSGAERVTLSSLLATQAQEEVALPLSPDLFLSLQTTSYRRLKYSEGFYANFAMEPSYPQWVAAAVHADSRRTGAGAVVMSACLKDDIISAAERGHVPKAKVIDKIPVSTGGLLRFSMSQKGPIEPEEEDEVVEAEVDNKMPRKEIRNTEWRLPAALEDSVNTVGLPDWWWEEASLFLVASEAEGGLEAAFTANLMRDPEVEMRELSKASSKRKDAMILDMMAVSGKEETDNIMAGRSVTLVSPLNNLVSSHNYLPCSVRGAYGAVRWVGTLVMRHAYGLGQFDKWKHLCCVLVSFRGNGRLLLYELSGTFIGRLRLELLSGIHAVPKLMHGFHMYEGEGEGKRLKWEIASDEASEKQSYCISQRFLREVLLHRNCDFTSMVHAGHLEKAPPSDFAAYRKRWMILLSSGILVWYRNDDFLSKYKGELDLRNTEVRVYPSSGAKLFSIESTNGGKKYRFRAETKEEKEDWCRVLGAIIAVLNQ